MSDLQSFGSGPNNSRGRFGLSAIESNEEIEKHDPSTVPSLADLRSTPAKQMVSDGAKLEIDVRRIQSVEDTAMNGFVAAYQEAFSREPYNEKYTESEVKKTVWGPHIPHCLLVAECQGQVVGFACAHPLNASDLSQQAMTFIRSQAQEFNPDEAIYVSELGVLKSFERRGIGSRLVLDLYRWGLENDYKYLTTRTAGVGSNSLKIFRRLGGQPFGPIQFVESGEHQKPTSSNCRIYLWGNLREVIERADMTEATQRKLFSPGSQIHECYPGGNDTYIVCNPMIGRGEYALVDRMVKAKWPQFEQGAFLEPAVSENAVARMQMAGGELCGNATRAMAALLARDYWSGQSYKNRDLGLNVRYGLVRVVDPDTIKFPLEVSGTDRLLTVTVARQESAMLVRTEMPIRPDFSEISSQKVELDGKQVSVSAVRMDGIIHLVVDEQYLAFNKEPVVYEKWIADAVSQLNLTQEPAVGLIFTREDQLGTYINPLVWVRAVNSCFYESACGSGTLAVALARAKQRGTLPTLLNVFQPSGSVIKTEVFGVAEEQRFDGASIEGPVMLKGDLNAGRVPN